MRYQLTHRTQYRYSDPVTLCHNEVRMQPIEVPGQRVLESLVDVQPQPSTQSQRTDHYGNRVTYFAVEEPHDCLVVTVRSRVDTENRFAQSGLIDSIDWEDARAAVRDGQDPQLREVREFLYPTPMVPLDPGIARYAAQSFRSGRGLAEAAHDLMHRIHADFRYDPVATTLSTPIEQVFRQRRGVCQDFAHVALAGLRALGIAASYVSGYLETQPPPGQAKLQGADASHAWFSIFVPGQGWIDFDPTNDQQPTERYVVVARGRDYGDVAPLKGVVFGGGQMTLNVGVDVIPLERT